MTYIKHWQKFYKEIDIDSLTKKELIEILKNAIELNPQVVDRVKDIARSQPRYEKENWLERTNVAGKYKLTFTDTLDSNLQKLKVSEVLSLVKNI